jgi:hypothetical protein
VRSANRDRTYRRVFIVDPAATTTLERLALMAGELHRRHAGDARSRLVRVDRFDVVHGVAVFTVRDRRRRWWRRVLDRLRPPRPARPRPGRPATAGGRRVLREPVPEGTRCR